MTQFSYDDMTTNMVGVMKKMAAFVTLNEKLALPKPPAAFTAIQQILEKVDMNIVVCGKVKNGKSSLINAIIGRPLLPVCSDVATSQVFKLVHSEKDCFTLVYANGDRKQISFEDLSLYGSQATIDKKGIKDASTSISYIEVGAKLDFLPNGVSLIDTPGIGSLYPQHTAITRDFVQMADAVLFVMNPTPLEKPELDFLKELVRITPNLMFVMTKAEDLESVEQNIKRNTVLIKNAIGDKLYREIVILPMSSTTLMDAAQSTDKESVDFNFEVSGYTDVKSEMMNLVSLTKGYYRVGEAFNHSIEFYNDVLQNIQNRINVAKATGQKNQEINAKIQEARSRLTHFGKSQQQELMAEVDLRIKAFYQSFCQKLQTSSGPIVSKYYADIDLLSAKELQDYADSLPNKLIAELQEVWTQLQHTLEKEICSLLSSYSNNLQQSPDGAVGIVPIKVNEIGNLEQVGFRKRALNARNEAMIGIGGLTILSYLGVTAIPVVGPILAIGALGYAGYGIFAGNTRAKAEVLEKNQRTLKQFVRDTVSDFYKQYNEVSLENGQYSSIVDGYKQAVRTYAVNIIQNVYAAYEQEVRALEDIQNGNKAESVVLLNGIAEKWKIVEPTLVDIRKQLESISSSIK